MNLGGGNWTIEAAAATNQNGGPVTITVTVNDGTTTTNETFDVTVTAVNDAPVNSVPSAQFTDSNTPLILTGPNALSITDIDAGTSDLEITLAAINGTLTLNGTPSLSFTTGSGINDGVMVFRGRLSNINAALDGLTFDPTPGYNGTASISLKTDDLGNTGSGGSLSAKDVVSVTVGNATATFQQGVNSYTGTEDTELQNDNPSTSFGTATTISVDLQNGSLESQGLIQFANLFGSGPGQIPVGSVIDAASLTVTVFDEGNSAATISLHQMLTAWTEASTWNSATNGIQRNNVEAASVADSTMTLAEFTGPQTFDGLESTVQAWADGAANNGWVIVTDSTDGWDFYSSEDSTTSRRPVLTISYTAPIPAQIDLDANNSSGTTASGFAATFTEDGPAVLIADFDATLTDADDTQLQSMTVSLTNLLDVGAESLTANTAGTSITASYNPGAGVLTLTNADSLANYQQVLKTITYQNVSDTPNTTTRVITVVGNDGFANSNIATTSIAIVASNDAPSGLPTITGTVTEDQTLTADMSGISDADGLGVFSYQWLRNGSVIAGATSSTYTLGDADVGTLISVQVNYTDGDSTAEGPLTSAQTSAVANVNDVPTGTVTIDNMTPSQGDTLTAGNTLGDADGLSGPITYQWQRNGVDISGATAGSYTTTVPDVGTVITVVASYTDDQGTNESVSSAATAPVANTNDPPTGSVTISGTPTEDQILTASNTLADLDGLGPISYQWQRDTVDITGATSGTYTLADADVGATITVVARYTDGGGTPESVSSSGVGPIINVNDAPVGVPAITGTITEDQILTADTSGISDADGLGTFSYQWLRNGIAISGATGSTYTLGDADVGTLISVQIGYTDGQGTTEGPITSTQTPPIANVNDAPVGVPVITGTPTEDQILTADTGGISDADGLGAFSYQWLRNGSAIGGATGNAYTLSDADVGTFISVEVSYTDGHGTAEGPLTSAQTSAITNVNDEEVLTTNTGLTVNEGDVGSVISQTVLETTDIDNTSAQLV